MVGTTPLQWRQRIVCQRQGCQRSWLPWGALFLSLVSLGGLMLLGGCSESPEVGVRRAVEQVPMPFPSGGLVDSAGDYEEERPIRRRLAAYDPQEAARIVDGIYTESGDTFTQARALVASRLLLADDTPLAARRQVLDLARRGLESADDGVSYFALRALRSAPDVAPDDALRVERRIEAAQTVEVIDLGYGILAKWKAGDVIAKQILRPIPPKTETLDYCLWAVRTDDAITAWADQAPKAKPIPPDLAGRFLELMQHDSKMARVVAHALIETEATHLVPDVKAKVYLAEGPAVTRAIAAALILALSPQEGEVWGELPGLLRECFPLRPDAIGDRIGIDMVLGQIATTAAQRGDTPFVDAVWSALEHASETQRADFIRDLVFKDPAGARAEPMFVHVISRIPDAELSRLLASSRPLQLILRCTLLGEDPALALPKQGTPPRDATEQRVRSLLEKMDGKAQSDALPDATPR